MSKRLLLLLLTTVIGTVAVSLFLLAPKKSESCGPYFLEALFTYQVHPDLPLDTFAAGKLGILRSSFARSYLTVAYRQLSGHPLTKSEQEDAVSLWETRLSNADMMSYSSFDSTLPNWDSLSFDILPPYVKADSGSIENYTMRRASYNDYSYYRNINPSAVQNATRRLLDLVRLHGKQSEEVRDWITSQRIVFTSDGSSSLPLYTGPNKTIRVDREYQAAAYHFYAGHYDSARLLFERIAQDAESPWQKDGLYLAARAMVRKGSLGEGNDGYAAADSLLQKINDPAMATPKLYLLDYLRGWTDPESQVLALSKRLQDNDPSHFQHELDDYTKLLDRVLNETAGYDNESTPLDKLPEALAKDDMTDWVHTFASSDSNAADHAMERWLKTKSTPWMIAALSKARSLHVSFFTKIDPRAPEYESYVYYLGKLLHKEDDTEILRPMLDEALATPLTRSGRNELMRIRQDIATDMTDLLQMISRRPVGLAYEYDGNEMPEIDSTSAVDYDEAALRVLNRSLPFDRIVEAFRLGVLRGEAEQRLVRSAWSRATILGREDDALRIAKRLENDSVLAPWMKRYFAAKTGEARKREAIFIHLKHPGLSPLVHLAPGRETPLQEMDSYRDNGWGALHANTIDAEKYGYDDGTAKPAPIPFLTKDELEQRELEWKMLVSASPSPNYLLSETIKWAKAAPKDADVAEALHLAIRLSRYGRNDEKTGSLSKQAHTILHQKYGKTKFAKATPYWYD